MDTPRRLHAGVASEHLVAVDHMISRDQPLAPTRSLAMSDDASFVASPASFNANAYSSAGANAHPRAVSGVNGPTQASTRNNTTAVIAVPANFEVNAYSSLPTIKDAGGLVS